jgi:hypothetical protein
MFWNYFLQLNSSLPGMVPIFLPINSVKEEPVPAISQEKSKRTETTNKKSIKLNLKAEDLLKAGYESSKKSWS